MKFELVSPYEPFGDQIPAIKKIVILANEWKIKCNIAAYKPYSFIIVAASKIYEILETVEYANLLFI